MATVADVEAMRLALELSRRGPSNGPNPRVGCVILSPDGRVLAEGWHRGRGTPHAEVDALSRIRDCGADARGATVVVTLEPCNHTGTTSPCSEALIEAGIARVVYAVADPGRASAGGGARLRAAGIAVESGPGEQEVSESILPWLTAMRRGTPFVTVKWASSLDGRAAAKDGTSRWITGPDARTDVHRRRSEAGAVAIGTGTVLADNPALTARDARGALLPLQPIPVVVGTRPIPRSSAVFDHPKQAVLFRANDLLGLLDELAHREIRHVFVEGGPTIASAFVSAGLADEILVYLAPTLLGGPRTALGEVGVDTIAQQRRLRIHAIDRLGDDILVVSRPLQHQTTEES